MAKQDFHVLKFEVLFPFEGTQMETMRGKLDFPKAMMGQPEQFEAHLADLLKGLPRLSGAKVVKYVYRDYASVHDADGKVIAIFKDEKTSINLDMAESIFA